MTDLKETCSSGLKFCLTTKIKRFARLSSSEKGIMSKNDRSNTRETAGEREELSCTSEKIVCSMREETRRIVIVSLVYQWHYVIVCYCKIKDVFFVYWW